jgi:hypothetical protein
VLGRGGVIMGAAPLSRSPQAQIARRTGSRNRWAMRNFGSRAQSLLSPDKTRDIMSAWTRQVVITRKHEKSGHLKLARSLEPVCSPQRSTPWTTGAAASRTFLPVQRRSAALSRRRSRNNKLRHRTWSSSARFRSRRIDDLLLGHLGARSVRVARASGKI